MDYELKTFEKLGVPIFQTLKVCEVLLSDGLIKWWTFLFPLVYKTKAQRQELG